MAVDIIGFYSGQVKKIDLNSGDVYPILAGKIIKSGVDNYSYINLVKIPILARVKTIRVNT